METSTTRTARHVPTRLEVIATAMAASVFLLPVALGKLYEVILKGTNPDNVDVSQGLAYLSPLLIASFVTFGVWLVACAAVVFLLQRKEGAPAARLPWLVLAIQVVLGLVFLALQGALNGITTG